MALFRPAPVRLQPYFGYRSTTHLRLRARALRRRERSFAPSERLGAVRTMLGQFLSRKVAGLAVTLEMAGPDGARLVADTVSDAEGYVQFNLPLEPGWALPDHPAWEHARLSFRDGKGSRCFAAHVLAPGLDSRLAVISDIDDTIIETGITGGWRSLARNWRRVLAQLPDERLLVPGADAFYDALGGGEIADPPGPDEDGAGHGVPNRSEARPRALQRRIAATHRPFFYVSSSPWNLFSYLVAFQRAKRLPLGPLLLRHWGLNRTTLGSASHGQHKSDSIKAILGLYPELAFALIGDDTQGDLPAFAGAVEAFPGRIAAVFVRTVAGEALTAKEEAAIAAIRARGVALWLGESFAVGEDFLHTLGFTPGGETEQIVKVVEQVDEADAAE